MDPGRVFGTIRAPQELIPFITQGGSGAGGISLFLNNLITLIYSIAAVIFLFMFIWGAFEWITSGGEKERVANAQKRITHALIGVVLFAVAFAVISVVGIFTGFEFFAGQDRRVRERRLPDTPCREKYYRCLQQFDEGDRLRDTMCWDQFQTCLNESP